MSISYRKQLRRKTRARCQQQLRTLMTAGQVSAARIRNHAFCVIPFSHNLGRLGSCHWITSEYATGTNATFLPNSWALHSGESVWREWSTLMLRYTHMIYKVVQIWPGLFVCKQVTVCPGHIWTTLYKYPRWTWLNSRTFDGYNDKISVYLPILFRWRTG
jgi:hypothetical protein